MFFEYEIYMVVLSIILSLLRLCIMKWTYSGECIYKILYKISNHPFTEIYVFQILDWVLGHNEALFRRAQLKALVSIHSQEVKPIGVDT
jgi:hypothetical protein